MILHSHECLHSIFMFISIFIRYSYIISIEEVIEHHAQYSTHYVLVLKILH